MTRSLPSTPSLEHIKNEAKAIRKAHKAGDASVCAVLRNIKEFAKSSDQEILGASVSLQQVQYALAVDYCFSSWSALKQALATDLAREVAIVSQSLVAFLNSGMPLTAALDQAVNHCTSARLKSALTDISRRIREGSFVASSMHQHPDVFPEWAIAMIEVGEKTGKTTGWMNKTWNKIATILFLPLEHREEQDETREISRQRYFFLAKFTALLEAGMPLAPSLRLLANDTPSQPLREACRAMEQTILDGYAFSEAMAAYEQLLTPEVVALVKEGEAGGDLDCTLAKGLLLLGQEYEKPVTRFVNVVLAQAVEDGAAEVEFKSSGNELSVRYRIEGVWHELTAPPVEMTRATVARVKELSGIEGTENAYPREGSLQLSMDDKSYSMAVDVSSCEGGEVIRLQIPQE